MLNMVVHIEKTKLSRVTGYCNLKGNPYKLG